MEKNMDIKGRVLRGVAFAVFVGYGLYANAIWSILAGVIFLAGAVIGYCPFGKKTGCCGRNEKNELKSNEPKQGCCSGKH